MLFIICLGVKKTPQKTKCRREAMRSRNIPHACNLVLQRAYFPRPTQRRDVRSGVWCLRWRWWLLSNLCKKKKKKKEHHSAGSPSLSFVYESFMLTTIVHKSHFISLQRDATRSQHISLQRTCLLGVRWQVEEHPRHPFNMCHVWVLRRHYSVAVEADCLNVTRATRLYYSPYLLITSDSLMLSLPSFFFF